MLTIVMYHYVRDLPRTRYPGIKGLLTRDFEGQLDYIARHYSVCSFSQVIAAMRGTGELPSNGCLLTFDDGLIDHYMTVFPLLQERGMVGSFFPPAGAILEGRVLDVHKLQFILAASSDHCRVAEQLFDLLRPYRSEHSLPGNDQLWQEHAVPDRFNTTEAALIKRLLQRTLPKGVRSEITANLFARHVSEDEQAFAHELYMDMSQMRCMTRHGMEFGGHGYHHVWLGSASQEDQVLEITRTLQFLTTVYGCQPADWVMCYPYGSYNSATLQLLAQASCAIGLTTRVELVPDLSRPLELSRLDTNDLPVAADAALCSWTRQTLADSPVGVALQ